MKKTLISLAVAGLLSGTALAQSNVTVYGIVDVGYLNSRSDDLTFSGIESGLLSASRIGFRGTEALGNGLNVIYTSEFGFRADKTDTNTFTQRQTYVGLQSSKLGTVSFGRHQTVAFDWVPKGFSSASTGAFPSNVGNKLFVQLNDSDRLNNSIQYWSPNWNGLEIRANYGFGEVVGTPAVPGDTSDAARYLVGARYNNGPIDLALIYAGIAANDTVLNDDRVNGWSLGGSYDFKIVKVFAQYQMESNRNAVGGLKSDIDKDLWSVGLRAPISKVGTAIIEYVDYKSELNDGTSDPRAKGWGVGYEHSFSKRTTGYTSAGFIDNNAVSQAGFAGVGLPGQNNKTFAVGLRHSF